MAFPVRLVLVDLARGIGLPQRGLWELATRIAPASFEARVWLSGAAVMDGLAGAFEEQGIDAERFPDGDGRWSWRRVADVWFRLKRSGADLLHVHHAPGGEGLRLARLARSAGIRRVLVTDTRTLPHEESPALPDHAELAAADLVTVQSRAAAEWALTTGLDADRIRVVRPGIDPPDEEAEWPEARRLRDALGASIVRPLWVSAGPLELAKGHDVLLEALAVLVQRGAPFIAAIAGEGSRRRVLDERAQALGLAQSVRFLGESVDRGALLAAADLVILPSIADRCPGVVMEALVRGRPVVASAVGVVPEMLEDGLEGRLVPPGDPGRLAEAIAELQRSPETLVRMGQNAAARAREDSSWERVVDAYAAVYDEVLGLASFAPRPRDPAPGPRHRRGAASRRERSSR